MLGCLCEWILADIIPRGALYNYLVPFSLGRNAALKLILDRIEVSGGRHVHLVSCPENCFQALLVPLPRGSLNNLSIGSFETEYFPDLVRVWMQRGEGKSDSMSALFPLLLSILILPL